MNPGAKVIGGGMMARAFTKYRGNRNVVVFASGVSNSLETQSVAFQREKDLLRTTLEQNPDSLLLYFSTCSVEDPDRRNTPYVHHKLDMERVLSDAGRTWMVLRLPLAIGPGHRGPTLARLLHTRISQGESFEVWEHATRYPIDVDDVVRVASRFIEEPALWNRSINVALRSYRVLEFVRVMEDIVGRPARFNLVDRGAHYDLQCPELARVSGDLELDTSERYLGFVLRKYFMQASRQHPG